MCEMQQHFVDHRKSSPEECVKGVEKYDMPLRKFRHLKNLDFESDEDGDDSKDRRKRRPRRRDGKRKGGRSRSRSAGKRPREKSGEGKDSASTQDDEKEKVAENKEVSKVSEAGAKTKAAEKTTDAESQGAQGELGLMNRFLSALPSFGAKDVKKETQSKDDNTTPSALSCMPAPKKSPSPK